MIQVDHDRPQIARVYDYVLGGQHNFPVDQRVAGRIMEVVPAYPKWARLNRSFLQWAADHWVATGQRYLLDLGSGLPTQGHFHERMPAAQILYSDYDAFCVMASRTLVAHLPKVAYVQADIREPEQVLRAATRFFPPQPRVAIGFIGVAYMLNDDQVTAMARRLYAWSAPGSEMALSFFQRDYSLHGQRFADELQQRLEQLGLTLYYRTPAQLRALLAPWHLVDTRSLEAWIGQDGSVTVADRVNDLFWMSGALLRHD